MSTDKSGTAFPGERRVMRAGYLTSDTEPVAGMTMRDYFAAKAVVGIVAITGYATPRACKDAAECAYNVADAMLKEREK